jgi:4-amino-4-deoxy-L-arabinose transferase-like glycosyltransferase
VGVGTTKSKLAFLLLFAVFVHLQFFHQLGRLGLVGPDEPRYAQVAKEMALSGDFITPRLYGETWFEKPILYYWLTALTYKTLGVSEFAARLPSAVAGLLGVLAVFWIGWHWISFQCGITAGLILAASPLYFSLARAASTDMLLTSMLTLSLASLYLGLFKESGNTEAAAWASRGMYGFYGFLALAVLAKGPVGVVLAAATVGVFVLLTGQLSLTRRIVSVRGALFWAGITLPWYLLCYRANGWPFVEEFLLDHNLARFATDRFQHSQPFWFYLPVLFGGFFPWMFQLIGPAWRSARKREWTSRSDRVELLLWSWALVPLMFFSFSKSKLPGYVLPMVPALALLAAREWERLRESLPAERSRFWSLTQAGFVFLLGLVLPLAAGVLNLNLGGFLLPLTAVLCGVGACGMLLARRRQWRPLLGVYLLGVGATVGVILHGIVPAVDFQESSRQLAAVLTREGFSGEPIFIYGLSRRVEYGLNFYLNTKTKIIYSEEELEYPKRGSFFLLTTPSADIESLFPRARRESQCSFHQQRIVRMSRRSPLEPEDG